MLCFRLVDALKDRDIVVVAFVKVSCFVCMSSCCKVCQGTAIVIAELGSSGITQNAALFVTKVTVEAVVGDERVVALVVEETVFVLCASAQRHDNVSPTHNQQVQAGTARVQQYQAALASKLLGLQSRTSQLG